jgi:hypothetical protein
VRLDVRAGGGRRRRRDPPALPVVVVDVVTLVDVNIDIRIATLTFAGGAIVVQTPPFGGGHGEQ